MTSFKTNLHPTNTQKTCLFKIFLLITMLSNFNPQKKSSVTAPGANTLLVFDDAWLFETPKINNQIVISQITLIVLGDENAHSFEITPKENHGVTAPSAHI